ncbi:hypothetical protein [Aureivirga marina]|uniref:hypothetical protein n=1 Tax=Aureivirga marina TaxID=1182451 RepID=UPI0018CA305D|nr:hypothetical protein [Aureivirga marina]
MKIAEKICYLLLLSIIATSCYAPLAVSKLEPLPNQEKKWHHGKEIIKNEHSDISVQCMYYKSVEKNLIFEVEITNNTGKSILIDPNKFYYTSYKKDTVILNQFVHAKDPELEILKIDKKLSKNHANEKNRVVNGILNTTLQATVQGIANSATKEETEKKLDENEEDLEDDRKYYMERHATLSDQRSYWETMLIRKTDLPSGYTMRGYVIFTRNHLANFYGLNLAIEKHTFEFDYKQILIQP